MSENLGSVPALTVPVGYVQVELDEDVVKGNFETGEILVQPESDFDFDSNYSGIDWRIPANKQKYFDQLTT